MDPMNDTRKQELRDYGEAVGGRIAVVLSDAIDITRSIVSKCKTFFGNAKDAENNNLSPNKGDNHD